MPESLPAAWHDIVRADEQRFGEMLRAWNSIENQVDVLRQAIKSLPSRGTALRLLLLLGPDDAQNVFNELIDCASVGHSDFWLAMRVIKTLPLAWTRKHIEPIVNRILDSSEDDEHYARFAQLFHEIDDALLWRLLARAAESDNPDVRDVITYSVPARDPS